MDRGIAGAPAPQGAAVKENGDVTVRGAFALGEGPFRAN